MFCNRLGGAAGRMFATGATDPRTATGYGLHAHVHCTGIHDLICFCTKRMLMIIKMN